MDVFQAVDVRDVVELSISEEQILLEEFLLSWANLVIHSTYFIYNLQNQKGWHFMKML